jgi:hypothetical protein
MSTLYRELGSRPASADFPAGAPPCSAPTPALGTRARTAAPRSATRSTTARSSAELLRIDRIARRRPMRRAARTQAAQRRRADGGEPAAQEHPQLESPGANAKQVACYRVYDADLPEYAAAIDVYRRTHRNRARPRPRARRGRPWSCSGYARGRVPCRRRLAASRNISHRRRSPRTSRASACSDLVQAAMQVFEVPRDRIALKTRAARQGRLEKYGRIDRRGEFLLVREGDAQACASTCSTTSTPDCSSTTARCACAHRARSARSPLS